LTRGRVGAAVDSVKRGPLVLAFIFPSLAMRSLFVLSGLFLAVLTGVLRGQDTGPVPTAGAANDPATQAVAAVATGAAEPARAPDLIEHLVDLALEASGINNDGSANTWQHFVIAAFILVASYVFRRGFTKLFFGGLRRLSARTETTLDDELFDALERPIGAFIALFGAVMAVKVLKLSPEADSARVYLQTVAAAVVTLWFFISAFNTILDHLHASAKRKDLSVAAFMPWIKKTLIALILIFGVLMVAQRLGADVKAFLAGLGIGGLAFALAAQDTLANVFGSVVVAVDQPFRIGDFVQIGAHQGTVEDIGLRSTKLRTPARSLIAIPNKTVAGEAINNFSRMPQRRVDQTIGLTYSSKSTQVEALLGEIRGLLKNDPEVHQEFIAVNFLNYGAFSLDVQIIYFTSSADLLKSFATRERLNLAIMRLVEAHGLKFAYPTQTIELSGEVAERLVGAKS
jgi:MscS family membrane protein